MYAVVQIGGHQYRVAEGDVIFVDKQSDEADQKLTFDRVLLISDGNGGVTIGKPVIEGAAVEAKLLENVKADKVMVFKKKRRKGYRVKRGHRQPMSRIEIEKISGGGKKAAKKSTKKTEEKQKTEEKPKQKAEKEKAGKLSTDMLAKEAIDHISNTPLDKLQGFVPDDEDRVTVLEAWESKQEEEAEKLSTDMLAKEAIDHINNTPLEELKGFVPDDEDRVTVLEAWENKQKENK
ncbi:MAG: 50S ribosomal protein L21 [Balneolaceae bacterium]|nr:50S ribosomal protein L21 [Balneolaceae bacterium]